MGMRFVDAQVACPVSPAVDFWSGTTLTSSFAFATYSNSVVVDGTLEVNTTVFTFDGADVGFKAAGSKIVVNPSCTLRIINASTLTNLDIANRWLGIEVLPGGRLEVDGSEICGAVTAIHCNSTSSTGAEFDVRNSFLRYNITSMLVGAYTAGQYPGFVHNTHFQQGTLPSMTPSTSFQGFYASSVDPVVGSGLVIGEMVATSMPNRFSELEYGIRVSNSTLEVFNSEFEAIQDIYSSGTGYAVHATEGNPGSFYLGVGFFPGAPFGGSLVGNTMTDCLHGVYVSGYDSVVINNNTMTAPTDSFRMGITVERVSFSISVLQNEIREFGKLGILLNGNPGLGGGLGIDAAAVSDNRIRGENLKTKGIFVDELVGGLIGGITGGITMKGNVIDRVWRGIGVQSSDATINIRDNQVDFRYPGTSITPEPAAGIYILSSEEALLLRNTISGNCPVPAGGGPCNAYSVANSRVRGIQLNQTINTQVFNNDIEYSGAGAYVQGPNFEGNMVCNNFFDNYTAVLWDNLPTDGFGATDGGTYSNRVHGLSMFSPYEDWSENTFTSSVPSPPPFRSWSINSADAGSVDWFYQSAPTYDFPGGTIGLVSLTALAPTVGDPTLVCSALLFAETIEDIEALGYSEQSGYEQGLNSMIRFRASTESLEDYYSQVSAWHSMGFTSSVLDSVLDLVAIRELEHVQALWLDGDLAGLEAQLASINPAVPQETLLKEVWEIRLAAAKSGSSALGFNSFDTRPFLTSSEVEVLESIAMDTALEHTQAAYAAQSLLGWSVLGDRWLLEHEEQKIASTIASANTVRVYPNPAQNTVTIESEQPIADIQLYNVRGELVLNETGSGMFRILIDVRQLASGEYLLKAFHEDGNRYITKLIIQ